MQINLLYIAIAVFLLTMTGLILTVLEFRYGAPKRQQEQHLRDKNPE